MKCPKCGPEICDEGIQSIIERNFGVIACIVCGNCGHEEKVKP